MNGRTAKLLNRYSSSIASESFSKLPEERKKELDSKKLYNVLRHDVYRLWYSSDHRTRTHLRRTMKHELRSKLR